MEVPRIQQGCAATLRGRGPAMQGVVQELSAAKDPGPFVAHNSSSRQDERPLRVPQLGLSFLNGIRTWSCARSSARALSWASIYGCHHYG